MPSSLVSKGFTFSQGKINLEVTLDREIYYHGEKLSANIVVTNNSRKTVKSIKCFVVQHCEVTMVNAQFSKHVASLETREGCPITPGASFSKSFILVPIASSNKDRRGGKIKFWRFFLILENFKLYFRNRSWRSLEGRRCQPRLVHFGMWGQNDRWVDGYRHLLLAPREVELRNSWWRVADRRALQADEPSTRWVVIAKRKPAKWWNIS